MRGVYLLLLVCVTYSQGFSQVEKPTYHSYAMRGDSIIDHVIDALLENTLKENNKILLSDGDYSAEWKFREGDPAEGLFTRVNKLTRVNNSDWQAVALPHRVEKSDHPLWYQRTIKFRSKGLLRIDADDGAQLFLNDRQIFRKEGNYFPIDAKGTFVVTIRVLNNAMSGGLRRVRFINNKHFGRFISRRATDESQREVVHKLMLLTTSTKPMPHSGNVATIPPDFGVIDEVSKRSEEYPLLLPCLLPVSDSEKMVAVQGNNNAVTLRWGESADKLDHEQTLQQERCFFSLRELKANQKYFYQLRSLKTVTEIYSFTNNPTSRSFSFNVWADSQSGLKGFRKNMTNVSQANDAFGIGVGDLVSDGEKPRHWQKFFDVLSISASRIPYYLIAGNHDYDGFYDSLDAKLYHAYTNRPTSWFSWTHQNAAFIALDPNENFPIGIAQGSPQQQWLVEQLQSDAWKKAKWHFVLLHQTLYSQGWAGYHGDEVLRKTLEPWIEPAQIDFIISGHTHDYERLTKTYGDQKVTFLIVGGAGGSLEPPESSEFPVMDKLIKKHHIGRFYIDGEKLRFEAINLDNQVIDTFQFEKP